MTNNLGAVLVVVVMGISLGLAPPALQPGTLPVPGFHHLHLNTVDVDRAVGYYTGQFSGATRSIFAGEPAVKVRHVYLLFNRVDAAPRNEPQSAYWHFGWHVINSRDYLAQYRRTPVKILPLFTSGAGDTVSFSSDAALWPGNRTRTEIAEARAANPEPRGGAGYLYIEGPEGVKIEVLGDRKVERFNHVHMYQDDAFCAERWYQQHFSAPLSPAGGRGRPSSEADCQVPLAEPTWLSLDRRGTVRTPAAGVVFDDVEMNWYQWAGKSPLASSRGQAIDHVGLSVADLDAWLAKLRRKGVTILQQPYRLGGTRAFLIEGPSRERIELVEQRSR